MKVIDSPEPDIFAAESVPEEKCQPFQWTRETYVFKSICTGRVQVQLRRDDLSIKAFAFDAGGLPVQAKSTTWARQASPVITLTSTFKKRRCPAIPSLSLCPGMLPSR